MERAAYQPDLRPHTLPELLDLAFRLYRTRLRHYLSMIAFLFLGLAAFGLNYLNMGRLSFDTWLGVFALGMAPPPIGVSVPGIALDTAAQLQAAFGREFFFADGAIFWTIAAALLAPATARAYLFGETRSQHPTGSMMRMGVWGLAVLVSLPIILLRLAGVPYLTDLLRFPVLLAPHIMILERASIGVALRRGWALVRRDLPRSLAMFGVSLALVRLAAAMPFAGLFLIHRAAPELLLPPGRFLLPLALLTELLVYPVAQIAVTLLYYDLRIRREGFDIALAARRRGQEVANTA